MISYIKHLVVKSNSDKTNVSAINFFSFEWYVILLATKFYNFSFSQMTSHPAQLDVNSLLIVAQLDID